MTGQIRAKSLIAAAAAAALAAGAAGAQPKPGERPELMRQLMDCRKIEDDAKRLACFDERTAAMDVAETKGDLVVVDRQQAREVRRQAFGFTLPSMSLFERGEKEEELNNVSGVVRTASTNGAGKWVIQLEDGAVWAQTDTEKVPRTPRPGMKVELRRAAMGSYFMNIDGQRAVRATRVK